MSVGHNSNVTLPYDPPTPSPDTLSEVSDTFCNLLVFKPIAQTAILAPEVRSIDSASKTKFNLIIAVKNANNEIYLKKFIMISK